MSKTHLFVVHFSISISSSIAPVVAFSLWLWCYFYCLWESWFGDDGRKDWRFRLLLRINIWSHCTSFNCTVINLWFQSLILCYHLLLYSFLIYCDGRVILRKQSVSPLAPLSNTLRRNRGMILQLLAISWMALTTWMPWVIIISGPYWSGPSFADRFISIIFHYLAEIPRVFFERRRQPTTLLHTIGWNMVSATIDPNSGNCQLVVGCVTLHCKSVHVVREMFIKLKLILAALYFMFYFDSCSYFFFDSMWTQ